MKTPIKISIGTFLESREAWREEFCKANGDKVICKKCGEFILFSAVWVSIHDSRFPGCVGGGHVARVVIPYCPRCEGEPENQGCFHEDLFLYQAMRSNGILN